MRRAPVEREFFEVEHWLRTLARERRLLADPPALLLAHCPTSAGPQVRAQNVWLASFVTRVPLFCRLAA